MAVKRPRRHHHLSRESIALAALALVDREGADALTLRRVADSLDVGVMSLYTYVEDKDGLVRDIVALLLDEIEVPEDPGMTWEEGVRSVANSLRAMALRHPHAFVFVVLARYDEPAVVRYARRVDAALVRLGIPRELLPMLASLLDAHGTGFLLAETQHVALSAEEARGPLDYEPEATALISGRLDADRAFGDGLETIIAGFKVRYGLLDIRH